MEDLVVVTGIDLLERENRLTVLRLFHVTQQEYHDAPDDTPDFTDIEKASLPHAMTPDQVKFLYGRLGQRLKDLGEL